MEQACLASFSERLVSKPRRDMHGKHKKTVVLVGGGSGATAGVLSEAEGVMLFLETASDVETADVVSETEVGGGSGGTFGEPKASAEEVACEDEACCPSVALGACASAAAAACKSPETASDVDTASVVGEAEV